MSIQSRRTGSWGELFKDKLAMAIKARWWYTYIPFKIGIPTDARRRAVRIAMFFGMYSVIYVNISNSSVGICKLPVKFVDLIKWTRLDFKQILVPRNAHGVLPSEEGEFFPFVRVHHFYKVRFPSHAINRPKKIEVILRELSQRHDTIWWDVIICKRMCVFFVSCNGCALKVKRCIIIDRLFGRKGHRIYNKLWIATIDKSNINIVLWRFCQFWCTNWCTSKR